MGKIKFYKAILLALILSATFISCSKNNGDVRSNLCDCKYYECSKYVQSNGTLYAIKSSNVLSKGVLEFVCKSSSGVKRFIIDFQSKTLTEFPPSAIPLVTPSPSSSVTNTPPAYTQDTEFMKLYSPYIKMGRNSTNLTTWIDAGNLKSPVGSYGFANQHKVNNNWQDKGYLSSNYIQRMLNTVDKDQFGNPKAGFFSPAGRIARNNFMTAFNDAANRGDMVTLKDGSMAILSSYDQGRIWIFHNQNDPNPSKRGYMEQVNAFSYPELLPRLQHDYRQAISSQK